MQHSDHVSRRLQAPETSNSMGGTKNEALLPKLPSPKTKGPSRAKKTRRVNFCLVTGKYGCTEVRVYPAECGEQLGTDPSKIGSSQSLVLKSFSGEGTLWDSSLPISLTLWDTRALFAPPLPLPQPCRLCGE